MKKIDFVSIKKYVIFAGILLAIFVLVLIVTRKKPIEQKEDALPVIKIEKPTIGNLQESVQINGYVEAKSMISVSCGTTKARNVI